MTNILLEIRELCAFYGRTQVLFGFDLKVMFLTVPAVLSRKGAD